MSKDDFVNFARSLQALGATYVKAGDMEVVLGPTAPAEFEVPAEEEPEEPTTAGVGPKRRAVLSADFIRDNYGSSIGRHGG